MNNVVGANSVNKVKFEEQELLTATVNADVAIVLPIDVDPDAKIELQYDTIAKAINDYVERYAIDARVEKVEYNLSTPELPDKDATNDLKESLTGTTNEITSSKGTIHVENDALKNNKVTLTFELSVEEDVYLDETGEIPSDEINCQQVAKTSSQKSVLENKVSSNVNSQQNGDLILQSAEPKLYWQSADPKLYWQNAPQKELYRENTPTDVSKKNILNKIKISDKTIDTGIETFNIIGSGIESAMFNDTLKLIKLGDNRQIYTNPLARGNKYYKIVGTVSDDRVVKRFGNVGKVISYGTTIYKASEDFSKAKTSQEKGRVVGATAGKVGAGTLAGTAASAATTAVLVTIAGAAGVAAAPVTLIVIAGCSIVAGVAASSAVEGVGEEIGGNFGVGAVNLWQNLTKNK